MKPAILPYLRCPICGQQVNSVESGTAQPGVGDFLAQRPAPRPTRALRCPRGHAFDIARQGYVNLSAGRAPQTGDSAEMVEAREEFLAAGHYDFVSAAVRADVVREATRIVTAMTARPGPEPMLVVDAGAGTGRHLAAALDALPAAIGLALDASKPALRRAARVHPRVGALLCDTWRTLPLADRSAALMLNIFAPRNGPEFHRVLRPDGALLVVTPAADHLQELVGRFRLLRVDPTKTDRVAESLGDRFRQTSQRLHERRLALSRRDVRTLIAMGPSAWHTDPVRLGEQIAVLSEPVTVTASIRLAVYRPD